jgi:F0F1-type ATP synthase assembly protein I
MVGFFGGRWIDERLGTSPWLSLLGFLFGCGAAGKAIHRTWREMQAVTTREEREQGNPAPRYEKSAEGSHDQPSAPMSSPEEQDDERAR